jgi:hypothetical protein
VSFSRRRGAPTATFRHTQPKPTFKKAPSRRPYTSTTNQGLCDYFNIPRGCKKSRCNYSHHCARCKASSHGLYSCPN